MRTLSGSWLPAFTALVACFSVRSSARLACPEGCTQFGTCYEELGRCDCPWNYTGPACNTHNPEGYCTEYWNANTCIEGHPTLCLNACNGRGQCKGGFCHCSPGYFGTDCSLSYDVTSTTEPIKILDGMGYSPNKQGPLIYIYELPPEYHVRQNLHHVDRPPLHLAIYERIISGGHRTADASKADFFYVPITVRTLKKLNMLLPMLNYIRTTWSYWNQTGGEGALHIIPMEGDVGTCEQPIALRRISNQTTWLQFWGLYDYHPGWEHIFQNRIKCHIPGRDIVIPFMAMSSHDRFLINTPMRKGNKVPERNITFFFSGGVCGSGRFFLPPNCTKKMMRYSGGTRQKVWEEFHDRPGWRVRTKTDDFARDYASSVFCLAAPGGGWGKRGIVAAMFGCIPVCATDMLYEAFEPEMDWGRFGIRVSQADIPKLGDMLDNLVKNEPEKVAAMQEKLRCAAQHLHWSSNLGGIMEETGEFDAFASIMAILRMRKKYPGKDPSKYYELDQGFRDFTDCKPVNPNKHHDKLCTMFVGPGMELHGFMDACPEAKYYMRRKIGPPGGAVCHLAQDVATCPRFD